MDGSPVNLVTATTVTLRADTLATKMLPGRVRSVLWRWSREYGHPLPDALFHHTEGGGQDDRRPTIIWRPAQQGVAIVAVGAQARSVVLGAIPQVVEVLSAVTQQHIQIGVAPGELVNLQPAPKMQRYVARHVVFSRRASTIKRWEAADAAGQRSQLAAMIVRDIDATAEAWGFTAPGLAPERVRVEKLGSVHHGAAVSRDGSGKPIIGSALSDCVFSLPLVLSGPWAVGRVMAKGYGRMQVMGRQS